MVRTVECAACGRDFEGRNSRARYCSAKCRKQGQRTPAGRAAKGKGAVAAAESDAVEVPTLASLVGAELVEAAVPPAIVLQAMNLALRIESKFETGAAIASLSKELSRLRAAALLEARPKTRDALDDLKARRDKKLGRVS